MNKSPENKDRRNYDHIQMQRRTSRARELNETPQGNTAIDCFFNWLCDSNRWGLQYIRLSLVWFRRYDPIELIVFHRREIYDVLFCRMEKREGKIPRLKVNLDALSFARKDREPEVCVRLTDDEDHDLPRSTQLRKVLGMDLKLAFANTIWFQCDLEEMRK